MKISFFELRLIDDVMGKLYEIKPALKESKFGYNYKRFFEKNCSKVFKQYNDEIQDVRIENALEDPKTKALLADPNPMGRGYQFTKEGLRKCIEEENKVISDWNEKEFDIEPRISATTPEELTDGQKEILTTILIA